MKKLFISIIVLFVFITRPAFSQSVSISPVNDEILVTKYNTGTPNLAGRQSGGNSTTPAASSSNLGLAAFSGRGHSGTGFTGDRASILMSTDETFTSTAQGTRIVFNTTLNGTTFQTERMRIDNTGFIGIGTANPLRKAHIYSGTSGVTPVSTSVLMLENNASHYLQMASPEVSETGVLFGKPSSSVSGGVIYTGANAMNLRTGGNFNRVTITSTGNVGIGTTAPTAKLDIEGDVVVKKSTITATGTYNALNRSSGSSIYINASGTVTVNGIDGGVDGMILYLICGSGTTLVLSNENVSAAATDRIATHTGANVTISGRGGATFIYEGSGGRWRIVGVAQ